MGNKLINYCLIIIFVVIGNVSQAWAQKEFSGENFLQPISVFEHAKITNVGSSAYSVKDFIDVENEMTFEEVEGPSTNLGFSKDNYWLKFSLTNTSNKTLNLYFETGRPITDIVELHQIKSNGSILSQVSGDLIPFKERPTNHRKIIFPIELEANSTQDFYVQYQSDGEVINLPLDIHSSSSLMITSYRDQLIYGVFYGILLLAGAIYLFFYFGIREKSFLLYFAYVFSIAFLHLSLDGYFFQYITPNGGWFSNNAVLIAAAFSTLAFGRYTQIYMKVKTFSPILHKIYNGLHIAVFTLIGAICFIHAGQHLYYPLVNVLGIILLFLIVISATTSHFKNSAQDIFFTLGILSFFGGFIFFLLNNFGVIPNSFITENSSKLGTGLEIIFLSLSMANRIRILKSEKEKMQGIALAQSQESNEIKSFFLSNISHELRTPLNAVIGLSKSIQESTTDEKTKSDLEVIQYSSLGLLSAIDDILDYSKIEKKELKLEERQFDLTKMVKELRTTAENQAKDKKLNFVYEEINQLPRFALGDRSRLRQIILNLLNNAIKFTNTGDVKLSIKTEVMPNNILDLKIKISDTGVGIRKEKLERIFESFIQEQIDDKRKFGGFGLGLCIVKALVELHEGKVNIQSEHGEGTTVDVSLALNLPEHIVKDTQSPTHEKGIYDLNGKNILIVEDNPVNQMVMKSILRKWKNTTFDIANHGLEALDKLKEKPFDLILMDLQMPEMDGYEATEAIRNGVCGKKYENIPIIAVTADATDKAKNKVKSIGMDDYMTKPVDSDELYAKVMNCFYLQSVDLSDVL